MNHDYGRHPLVGTSQLISLLGFAQLVLEFSSDSLKSSIATALFALMAVFFFVRSDACDRAEIWLRENIPDWDIILIFFPARCIAWPFKTSIRLWKQARARLQKKTAVSSS